MKQTVYALFRDHDAAHYAFQDLLSKGFSRDSIGLAIFQPETKPEPGETLVNGGALAGLGAGVVYGGVFAGVIGVLSTFLFPSGELLAGPMAWLVAGAASGGAAGTFLGGLIGFGIPKDKADFYAEGVRNGGTLLVVGVDDSNMEIAEEILDRDGAIDIGSRDEEYQKESMHRFEDSGRIYTAEESDSEPSRLASQAKLF